MTLAFALGLCGCAAAPPAFHAPDGSVRPYARIDAEFERLMAAAAVPGLALALIEDGKVVYQRAYGLADRAAKRPLRTDTIMYGASLTKAAFAYLAMQLVDDGVLELDTALARHHAAHAAVALVRPVELALDQSRPQARLQVRAR
jgi:CubicO group peptidase (beta-lactamase class C family)